MSRTHIAKIRKGQNIRIETMLKILQGARLLTGRRVHILELFDLDSDDVPPPGHQSL